MFYRKFIASPIFAISQSHICKGPNPFPFVDAILRSPDRCRINPHIQRFVLLSHRSYLSLIPISHRIFAIVKDFSPFHSRCELPMRLHNRSSQAPRDIAIAHHCIAYPIYSCPLAPPMMRYCDFLSAVGSTLT